jgi:hypothetical protein
VWVTARARKKENKEGKKEGGRDSIYLYRLDPFLKLFL